MKRATDLAREGEHLRGGEAALVSRGPQVIEKDTADPAALTLTMHVPKVLVAPRLESPVAGRVVLLAGRAERTVKVHHVLGGGIVRREIGASPEPCVGMLPVRVRLARHARGQGSAFARHGAALLALLAGLVVFEHIVLGFSSDVPLWDAFLQMRG